VLDVVYELRRTVWSRTSGPHWPEDGGESSWPRRQAKGENWGFSGEDGEKRKEEGGVERGVVGKGYSS
jgi:hypothetical protein